MSGHHTLGAVRGGAASASASLSSAGRATRAAPRRADSLLLVRTGPSSESTLGFLLDIAVLPQYIGHHLAIGALRHIGGTLAATDTCTLHRGFLLVVEGVEVAMV